MTRRSFFHMFGIAAIVAPVAKAFAAKAPAPVLTQEFLDECVAVFDEGSGSETAFYTLQCERWVIVDYNHKSLVCESWGNCEIPVETIKLKRDQL